MTKKTTPTQRSLKLLRSQGYLVAITERWNPFAKIRQDLFGFVDLLCVRDDEVLAVQTTSDSGGNASKRLIKIQALQTAKTWLSSPNRKLHIHAWAKRGAKGKQKLWTCRTVPLCLDKLTQTIDMEPPF